MKKKTLALVTALVIALFVVMGIFFLNNLGQGDETKSDKADRHEAGQKIEIISDMEDDDSADYGNYNDDRFLKVKIKVGEEYIYESDYMRPDEFFDSDIIEKNHLDIEGKDAVAEVYFYTSEKEYIGQYSTNFE